MSDDGVTAGVGELDRHPAAVLGVTRTARVVTLLEAPQQVGHGALTDAEAPSEFHRTQGSDHQVLEGIHVRT